jgi:hypothetical protein
MRKPTSKPPGRVTSLRVTLTPEDRRTLEAWQRSTTISIGRANRGRMLLLLDQGWTISRIADAIPISRRFVYKWVARYLCYGLDGLSDLARPGAKGHRGLAHRIVPGEDVP